MFNRLGKVVWGPALLLALCLLPAAFGQDRYDRDRSWEPLTRLEPGTVIPVRTNDSIDVEQWNNRVYTGIVAADVRGDDGRLAIPRGAAAELIVRVTANNDLILDLESVLVNGRRYGVRSEPNRVESIRDYSLIGTILGAVTGGEARGRTVRIPRDSMISFRLDRPLDMGVADRGVTREGYHYHEYYRYDR